MRRLLFGKKQTSLMKQIMFLYVGRGRPGGGNPEGQKPWKHVTSESESSLFTHRS